VRRGGCYYFAAVCRVGAAACSTSSMRTADVVTQPRCTGSPPGATLLLSCFSDANPVVSDELERGSIGS
jgi:hypothetical protein